MTRFYILSNLRPSQAMEGGDFDIVTSGLKQNRRINRHDASTLGMVYYTGSPWTDAELEADKDALEVSGFEWQCAIEILNEEIKNL